MAVRNLSKYYFLHTGWASSKAKLLSVLLFVAVRCETTLYVARASRFSTFGGLGAGRASVVSVRLVVRLVVENVITTRDAYPGRLIFELCDEVGPRGDLKSNNNPLPPPTNWLARA